MSKATSLKLLLLLVLFTCGQVFAQKRPLDHSVYDGWESIGAATLSKDARFVYYMVNPQEGDSRLYVRKNFGNEQLAMVERASSVQFSPDEKSLVMLIKPLFSETREAKIKKKKPDEQPKDTLAILSLDNAGLIKVPAVKSFSLPREKGQYLAYMAEKTETVEKPSEPADSSSVASPAASPAGRPGARKKAESFLYLHRLGHGVDTAFERVDAYYFSPDGGHLFFVRKPAEKDSAAADAGLIHYDIASRIARQISSGKGTYKVPVFAEDGKQLAFLAYKGDEKAQVKAFNIYQYVLGQDSARVLADEHAAGIPRGWQVGENGSLRFSNDGSRLLFGIAPVPRIKDTTLVDFEHAKVDIWHWQDDYLQTQQLVNIRRDQQKTYTAVIGLSGNAFVLPLTDEQMPDIRIADEGDQLFGLGTSDFGRRIESQWLGGTYQDLYLVSTKTGERKLIKEQLRGSISLSPQGKYVLWFDRADANWYLYDIQTGSTGQLNQGMTVSFANEDNDSPDEPGAYGIAGWGKDDAQVFLYDKYDIWQFDLAKGTYRSVTNAYGRANGLTLRYQPAKPAQRAATRLGFGGGGADPIDASKALWLSAFNHKNKEKGWYKTNPRADRDPVQVLMAPYNYGSVRPAEEADYFIYTKESYQESPDLYISKDFVREVKLSATNPQQASYNWGTAELFEWTTPNGHAAQGIVYKPEDFDPNKKYPVIAYFYELLSDGLYSYVPPTPTPSRLNISYFVSNGYIVLAPDIRYEIGYPGKSAEEYVNSGMRELSKKSWVDAGKLAIQGQSWGGYQVAHLITRTDMYAAAWSGAPVVNMTSAYGGIRWQTGMNRQFQYERTQSRIGATLWERPDLYIENSPLFHLPNVKTPVVIMHNDEDGAVPWYQGIEMFTALRRLGKPVWMLNYNGDAHNLVQRQNRKDIQRRQQEFFDHFLKGKPAAPWIEKGVPAVLKGIDWGFGQ